MITWTIFLINCALFLLLLPLLLLWISHPTTPGDSRSAYTGSSTNSRDGTSQRVTVERDFTIRDWETEREARQREKITWLLAYSVATKTSFTKFWYAAWHGPATTVRTITSNKDKEKRKIIFSNKKENDDVGRLFFFFGYRHSLYNPLVDSVVLSPSLKWLPVFRSQIDL